LVTFVTMAYIVILNPIILSGSTDVLGNYIDGSADGAQAFAQASAVTALTAGIMTILFGVVSRLPFGFAAGLGIIAFLAFSVVGLSRRPARARPFPPESRRAVPLWSRAFPLDSPCGMESTPSSLSPPSVRSPGPRPWPSW